MKVLFGTYPTAFHTLGGGEIQLLKYRKYLEDNDVELSFFDLWRPNFLRHDVLHFFSCMLGSFPFLSFVKNLGVSVIISPNIWITHDTIDNYPHQDIRRQLDLADRIVCNSDLECDLLSEVFSIDRKKFVTVYNGVDRIFFEAADPHLFRDEYAITEPFILNVANIEKRKNQLRLIHAAKQVGVKVVTVGAIRDTDYAAECFAAGQEFFVHVPYLPHDSLLLRSAYAACDLFALPSLLETPGLAALEAAASGARILITNEGSATEYFSDMVTYSNPLSVESILSGIRTAMRMPPNEALKETILRKFTWNTVIKDLVDVYHGHDVFPRAISLKGFHLTQLMGLQRAVWSRRQAALLSRQAGWLTFDWRALQRSLVDVKVNGVVVWSDL
ncbi:MAG: glycosyltransferase family 4 protein, partial [Betaproteobacteria bacterium]|nr:glycosyltransferase family 4 protein [Betaproteobacteria bacterium]